MKIDLDKIIPIERFINETNNVIEEVKSNKQLFIFENNMPQYVLLTQEQYHKLLHKQRNQERSEVKTIELLNGIGKKVFIDHYYEFKNGELLNNDYSIASKRSRIAKARKIFRSNNHLKALKMIIDSDRLEDEVIAKAQQIYRVESNGDYTPHHTHTKKEIKIGKLARKFISKMLHNERLSDEQVNHLQTLDYSKQKLNLNFPLLKKVVNDIPIRQQCIDSNGYSRYYKHPVAYKGNEYLICSQWFEELHRESLASFIRQFEEKDNE